MIVHYGYLDGSGEYFISIDTAKCTGCGECLTACPAGVFELCREDPLDPFREEPVAVVRERERKKIGYTCGPCQSPTDRAPRACVRACRAGAISQSW